MSTQHLVCFVSKHGQDPPTLTERRNLTDVEDYQPNLQLSGNAQDYRRVKYEEFHIKMEFCVYLLNPICCCRMPIQRMSSLLRLKMRDFPANLSKFVMQFCFFLWKTT